MIYPKRKLEKPWDNLQKVLLGKTKFPNNYNEDVKIGKITNVLNASPNFTFYNVLFAWHFTDRSIEKVFNWQNY